jgi:hypothetical protein
MVFQKEFSKCYCVASVTKTVILEGVQTIRRSTQFAECTGTDWKGNGITKKNDWTKVLCFLLG